MMNNEILNKDHFQIFHDIRNWKEAIDIVLKPLIDYGYVKNEYKEAIFENINHFGSSFIISPYVILPHAMPEKGVIKNSISVLLSSRPIYFENFKTPIKLVIILSAVDSKSHLQILRQISQVLSCEADIEKILDASTIEELYECFKTVD